MRNEVPKKMFTAWGLRDDKWPSMLVGGDGPLTYNDGTVDPDCQKKFYVITACNFEEAMAIYHLRQGWDPYRPEGRPTECPECGVLYYSKGSGQCWSCTHHS